MKFIRRSVEKFSRCPNENEQTRSKGYSFAGTIFGLPFTEVLEQLLRSNFLAVPK